jgi:hypothetical protein
LSEKLLRNILNSEKKILLTAAGIKAENFRGSDSLLTKHRQSEKQQGRYQRYRNQRGIRQAEKQPYRKSIEKIPKKICKNLRGYCGPIRKPI